MHYMHYKDYIHHGLAAEKTTPPLPRGGGNHLAGWGGGCGGSLLIYTVIYRGTAIKYSIAMADSYLNSTNVISPEASRFHSNVLSKSRQSHRAIDAATSTCARHQRRGRCCRRCLAEDATAAIKMEMLSMLSMKMDEHGDVFTCFYYHMLKKG